MLRKVALNLLLAAICWILFWLVRQFYRACVYTLAVVPSDVQAVSSRRLGDGASDGFAGRSEEAIRGFLCWSAWLRRPVDQWDGHCEPIRTDEPTSTEILWNQSLAIAFLEANTKLDDTGFPSAIVTQSWFDRGAGLTKRALAKLSGIPVSCQGYEAPRSTAEVPVDRTTHRRWFAY